jgi:hypothetical protein
MMHMLGCWCWVALTPAISAVNNVLLSDVIYQQLLIIMGQTLTTHL